MPPRFERLRILDPGDQVRGGHGQRPRSNTAIARILVVSEGAVEKHVRNILGKLGLPISGDDHRRVLAVLAFLRG